ncbi:MAG: hypothetical protein ACPGTQ_12210 [Colwellia sp.]
MDSLPTQKLNYWLGEYTAEDWHPKFHVITDLSEIETTQSTNSAHSAHAANSSKDNHIIDLIVVAPSAKNSTKKTSTDNLNASSSQDKILQAIRANTNTSLSLLLVHEESSLSNYLANGLWGEDALNKIEDFQKNKSLLQLNPLVSDDYKLLSYLWLHSYVLTPLSTPKESNLYTYPLLACWDVAPEKTNNLLLTINRKHWIEQERHINRTRHCNSCNSGHLNYVDTCPSCNGLDISVRASLHCFNCGHVGVQDSFKKLDTLSCPNCLMTLRHIGVDYDRPIENQHCNSCDTLFIDAQVQAQCLDCNTSHAVNDLIVNNIYSYRLSTFGKQLVRTGNSGLIATLFSNELLPFLQFSQILNWQNKIAIRYEQVHQILALELVDFEKVMNEIGDSNAFIKIDALRKRIRSALRETDLYSLFTPHSALMFFPHTDDEGIKIVIDKLYDIQASQTEHTIKFSIKKLSLPNADLPLDHLEWIAENLEPIVRDLTD